MKMLRILYPFMFLFIVLTCNDNSDCTKQCEFSKSFCCLNFPKRCSTLCSSYSMGCMTKCQVESELPATILLRDSAKCRAKCFHDNEECCKSNPDKCGTLCYENARKCYDDCRKQ